VSEGNGSSPAIVEWLRGEGEAADVVMSSRVRLARNLAGFPFITRASADDRRQIAELMKDVIGGAHLSDQMVWVDLADTPKFERELLVERHLISKQHSKGDEPRAVAVSSPDERLSIMVNEEDHLRIQALRSGLALSQAYQQADQADDSIEEKVDYAFSGRFGYLTACPTNVGTGIRVSVMLHLPALKLTGDIDKVRRAAKGMSLAVRGFYGEGSEAVGDIFQISNQTTLGKSEEQILAEFEQEILPKVIEYERHARRLLLERRRLTLEDRVHRAVGVLTHARLLNADEALHMLSQVRLGAMLGIIQDMDLRVINDLILLSQPAHLQRAMGAKLDQGARRSARADLIRQKLTSSN
jgi:protein arginine kinase